MTECVRYEGHSRTHDGRPTDNSGEGSPRYVYRDLWEAERGPLPDGIILHHTCETVWCINLDHLAPMTQSEHAAIHLAERNRQRAAEATHCKNGHPWSEENTRWVNSSRDGRYRRCLICSREAKMRYRLGGGF